MPLLSPLEMLIDTIELKVQETVKQRAKEPSKNYTYIGLNGECDNYKEYLDEVATNLLKKYSNEVQESIEREYFDTKFDSNKYESRINNIRKVSYGVATTIAGVVTTVSTFYLLRDVFDPRFSGEYIISPMLGFGAMVLESWFNPLGKLFMIPYGKYRLLGTKQHKAKLKEYCFKDVSTYLRNINPNNPILNPNLPYNNLHQN